MTVLVYRNGILAADKQITDGDDTRKYEWPKVTVLDDSIVGICGDMFMGACFINIYKSGSFKQIPDNWINSMEFDKDFEAIVIKEKSVKIYNHLLVPLDISDVNYFAMGSGADVAYGALYMGATAEEAVKAAVAIDAQSGFGTMVYNRADIPSVKRAKTKAERAAKRKRKK